MDMKEDDRFEEVVSNALRNEREFELSHNFADRVVKIIQQKAMQKEAKRDRWWLIAGVVGMVAALGYAMVAVEFEPNVGVFTFFQGYWGLVTFGVLFVIALNVIDKRVISRKSHGSGSV
jgi:hypothetical protein